MGIGIPSVTSRAFGLKFRETASPLPSGLLSKFSFGSIERIRNCVARAGMNKCPELWRKFLAAHEAPTISIITII